METLEGREFKLVDTSWMELILDERIEGWVVLGIITCVRLVFLGRNKKEERNYRGGKEERPQRIRHLLMVPPS